MRRDRPPSSRGAVPAATRAAPARIVSTRRASAKRGCARGHAAGATGA